MSVIKLYISLNKLSELLPRYDCIQVHRADSYDGTYTEQTASATRIRLEPGKSLYTYYDENGSATKWYKTRLYNSISTATSDFSEPAKGDETDALTGIMTVQDLKDIFLTGVDLTDDKGVAYPDVMFDFAIRAAIGWLESELDIECRPTWHTDRYDFDSGLWQQWGIIQLDHRPLIQVDYIKLFWPSASDPYEFPDEWIRADNQGGYITLVPTAGSLAQAMMISGAYIPTILSTTPYIPKALEVYYQSGWAIGTLPWELREMIGMRASFPVLNVAGDLVAGAGIANFSVSMDGLSQSIGTTSSATNAGYGARILIYRQCIRDQLPVLKRFYKGASLRVA